MAFPTSPSNGQIYKGLIYNSSSSTWKKPDYIEGTWNPTLEGTSGSCTIAAVTKGWYIKHGNTITVGGTLSWTSSTLTGYIKISGIPYLPRSAANGGDRATGVYGAIVNGSFTLTAGMTHLTLVVDPGLNYLYVIQSSGSNYDHAPTVNSSGTIYGFQVTYQI